MEYIERRLKTLKRLYKKSVDDNTLLHVCCELLIIFKYQFLRTSSILS